MAVKSIVIYCRFYSNITVYDFNSRLL